MDRHHHKRRRSDEYYYASNNRYSTDYVNHKRRRYSYDSRHHRNVDFPANLDIQFARWVVSLQNKYCPSTSYMSPSSTTLIINHGRHGEMVTVFDNLRSRNFKKIVILEEDEKSFSLLQQSVKKLDSYITFECIQKDILNYFNDLNHKYPNSIIIMDFFDLAKEKIEFIKNNKNRVPLFFCRVKCENKKSKEKEIKEIFGSSLLETFDGYSDMVVFCIGKGLVSSTNLQCQFRAAYESDYLWKKVENFILKQTRYAKKGLFREIMHTISKLVKEGKTDHEIYNELHTIVKNSNYNFHYVGNNKGRTSSRLDDVVQMVQKYKNEIKDVVDVGCAEGSITSELGVVLDLKKEQVHGCDIRDISSKADGYTFSLIKSDGKLPYESGKHSMVITFMSLHHIENVDFTIQEIKRILIPGGLFLIREHDCTSKEFSIFLDMVHGLYSMVFSDPQEDPNFCNNYRAYYSSMREWERKIVQHGFECLKYQLKHDYANSFYMLFRKKTEN